MFAPMILGYALGAVGVYAALYRFAPLSAGQGEGSGVGRISEDNVVVLFELPAEKAA